MTFAFDEKMHGSPEAALAGPAAVGAYALARSWCDDYKTSGDIPRVIAHRLAPRAVWRRAERAGLVIPSDTGYDLVGYRSAPLARGEPARSELSLKRAEAGRAGGKKSGERRREPTREDGFASPATPVASKQPVGLLEETGKQTGKQTNPLPPQTPPTPEAKHTHTSGARWQANEATQEADVDQLEAELRRHPAISAAARGDQRAIPALAEMLAGRAASAGRRVAWVRIAIADAAADLTAEPGVLWKEVVRKVRSYADRARAPTGTGDGSASAPQGPHPEDVPPPSITREEGLRLADKYAKQFEERGAPG